MTTTSETKREVLQKSWENSLQDYKEVFRYWHAVLTLQRPIDYGVAFGFFLLTFLYVASRDWTLATTFFLGVFFYFALALVVDMVGGIPYSKLLKSNYELSESDPFVIVAKNLTSAQLGVENTVAEMREFRRANSTLFTVQVCGAALVLAFVSSFFSGFTLAFLVLLATFVVPPVVVLHLHEQAWAKLAPIVEPHIDTVRAKLSPYLPMLAKKAPAAAATPAAAASKKQS